MIHFTDFEINTAVLLGAVLFYFGFRYLLQALVNLISPDAKIPPEYVIGNNKWEEDISYGKSDAYLRAQKGTQF